MGSLLLISNLHRLLPSLTWTAPRSRICAPRTASRAIPLSSITSTARPRTISLADPKECSDKEKGFIEKMKAKDKAAITKELERLTKMSAGSSMKASLKQWLVQRMHILKQL